MKQKTVVVIPGSKWQISLVKRLKTEGHRVLVVNPFPDSPAFPYADGHLQADMFDKEAVIAYCKAVKADAIMSEECDIVMPALAEYGQELGLPTLTPQDAHLFTDKYAMREFCKEHHLPYPEYKMCHNLQDAIAFFHSVGKKMIMKPLDSNSSRGVFTIEKEEDIRNHFDETLSFSRVEKAVLLERYIDGTEFTIDGVKTPQKHYSLMISEKKHFAHNKNVACELYFAHSSTSFDYESLRNLNDEFADASGLQFGLTHAEYKYEDGVFYLIEIAARGGGNLMSSHIVPFMSGIDNYGYLIECSLGNITCPNLSVRPEYHKRVAVLKFFDTPGNGGVVSRVDGIDLLRENPDIVSYQFNFDIGEKIELAKDDSKRVGYYIACCENQDYLDALMRDISQTVHIVYE